MKNITYQTRIIVTLLLISIFISCEKSQSEYNVICSFQNLICDDPINDSINVKSVETFFLFGNNSDDTIKISLKNFQDTYRYINKKDTFKIDFEAIVPISIPPHDSLGLPGIAIINKKIDKRDELLKKGFSIVNIKSKKFVPNALDYRLKQMYEFQLYKKWGRKNNNLDL